MHRLVTAYVDCADGFPFPVTASILEAFRQCASSMVSCQFARIPALDLGLQMLRPRAIKNRVDELSYEIADAIVNNAKQRSGTIDTYEEFCIIMVRISLEVLEAMPLSGPISNWDDRNEHSYLSKRKHGSEITQRNRNELDENRRCISYALIKYVGQLKLTEDQRQELDSTSSSIVEKYSKLLNLC